MNQSFMEITKVEKVPSNTWHDLHLFRTNPLQYDISVLGWAAKTHVPQICCYYVILFISLFGLSGEPYSARPTQASVPVRLAGK